jgi:hypothetical protein
MSRYYVGHDVHKASISAAVLNAAGKLVIESVVETGAADRPGSRKRVMRRICSMKVRG